MNLENKLKETLSIKNKQIPRLIQGGMGAGVSLMPLAVAVAQNGGVGTISSVALSYFTSIRKGVDILPQDVATRIEVQDSKKEALLVNPNAIIATNVMCRLYDQYEDSIKGSVQGNVDMIISGAGLPITLPSLVKKYSEQNQDVILAPMISGVKSLKMLMSRRIWGPGSENEYVPDILVLEGPKAGGHLGWSYKNMVRSGDSFLEDYDLLKVLLPEVLDYLNKENLDIPVYVAGGIWDKNDVLGALSKGASGVQVGTPFAVCKESGANSSYKKAVINSTVEDILIGDENWGSACGYPFRYLKESPMAVKSKGLGFSHFCICSGLFSTAGMYDIFPPSQNKQKSLCPERACIENGKCDAAKPGNIKFEDIYTVGVNASKVTANPNSDDGLYSAKEVIQRLGF